MSLKNWQKVLRRRGEGKPERCHFRLSLWENFHFHRYCQQVYVEVDFFSETQEAEEVKIAKVEKVVMSRWSYIYSGRSKTHFIVFYDNKHILNIIATNISEVENFEWHIIPLLNPDGYQYSRTTDRLWRKNRVMHVSCLYWNL